MALKLTDAAIAFLAEVGYDPVYGARPLKCAVQRELEPAIAIFVDVCDTERLTFKRLPSEVLTTQ